MFSNPIISFRLTDILVYERTQCLTVTYVFISGLLFEYMEYNNLSIVFYFMFNLSQVLVIESPSKWSKMSLLTCPHFYLGIFLITQQYAQGVPPLEDS